MLKRFKQYFQASSIENGVDLTVKDIAELHMDLHLQFQKIEEEILNAIDRNNYSILLITHPHVYLDYQRKLSMKQRSEKTKQENLEQLN